MKRLILISMLIFQVSFLNVAYAEKIDALLQLSDRVGQHAVLRADFTQIKHLSALKRPLISSGKLLYSKEYGVIWQITKPYTINYILSDKSIVEVSADGHRKSRAINEMPGFAQVSRIFRAMLGADASALNAYFYTEIKNKTNHKWEALLTPKQIQTSRFIKDIHIEGSQYVESIQINEASNDSTLIVFSHSEAALGLSDAELDLFGQKHP